MAAAINERTQSAGAKSESRVKGRDGREPALHRHVENLQVRGDQESLGMGNSQASEIFPHPEAAVFFEGAHQIFRMQADILRDRLDGQGLAIVFGQKTGDACDVPESFADGDRGFFAACRAGLFEGQPMQAGFDFEQQNPPARRRPAGVILQPAFHDPVFSLERRTLNDLAGQQPVGKIVWQLPLQKPRQWQSDP